MSDIKNYYSPYAGQLFERIYTLYASKLKGKHLSTHQPMISELYRSLYHEKQLGMEFEALLFQFFAISNSCDDLIDETPISNRKNAITNVATVFVSFFVFFEKLVDLFSTKRSEFTPIFDSWHINLPVVLKAPYLELNPPSNLKIEEAPDMLVLALKNRCVDHQFLCHFLDKAFKRKYSNSNLTTSYDLANVVVLIKSLEFLVKDLAIDELRQDLSSNSFNILIYLRSLLSTKNNGSVSSILYKNILKKTKELLYEEFRNAGLKLPERTRFVASKFFYEQEESFFVRLNKFKELYILLTEE
ncbi:MAG: hypothetical protein ACTSW1_13565 [Candidatus Hodarchaeales archaeon]